MVKKVILLLPVLFALLLFGPRTTCFADLASLLEQAKKLADQEKYEAAEAAFQQITTTEDVTDKRLAAHEALAIMYLDWGSTLKAELEYQKLLNDFGDHPGLAVAVDHIADKYRAVDKFSKARELYRYELSRWPDGEKAVDAQKNIAITSLQLKDHAGAQAAVEKLVADYSEHSDIAKMVEGVAEEYFSLERYDEARQWYAWVTANKPEAEHALWAQVGVAASSIAAGDYEAGQRNLAKLKTDFGRRGDIAKAIQEVGDRYAKFGPANSAVETYGYVVEHWPMSDEAMESQTRIAEVYIESGDEPNAAAATEKLLTEHSHHANLFEEIGTVADAYDDVGNRGEAARLFKYIAQTWTGTQDGLEAQMKLVLTRIRQWALDDAEGELGTLLTVYAEHDELADAVHEIVEEYRNTGAHEEGRELFSYLLTEWSTSGETMLELQVGVALQSIKLGELDKAKLAVDKVIADYNDSPRIGKALFQIGEEYYYGHKYQLCIDLLELIESSYPDREFPARSEVPFVLATCYEKLENYDKAIENYQRSVEEYPESRFSWRAPYRIGFICRRYTKDYEQAVYWFQQQRKQYPDSEYDNRALNLLGITYFAHLQDYAKAAEAFEEYLAKYADGIDIWGCFSSLAKCYAKLGDSEKALAVVQQAYEGSTTEDLRTAFMNQMRALQEEGGAK